MDANLSLYHIFYITANSGSISGAAKELYISQPAISKAIQRLEQSLDTILFVRTSRGVRLTDEGTLLYAHVKSAFEELQQGEQQLKLAADLGIGHLRIGVSATLCKYLLLPYLQEFISLHPHIRISIECQSTNRTLTLLEEGKIDLGLVGLDDTSRHIHFTPILEIQDIFVASQTYLENLRLRTGIPNCDVLKEGTLMLLDQGNLTRQYIDRYLQASGLETHNLLEATTMDLLIDFAKIGLGIACVIREFIPAELDAEALLELPLASPIPKRKAGFAHLKTAHPNHALKDFLAFIQKE